MKYEDPKKRIYDLFEGRNVAIEKKEDPRWTNFCCLRTKFYPMKVETLVVGQFSDHEKETLYIAHEFGHLLLYEAMSSEEAEVAHCTILAFNYVGLEHISDEGKRTLLQMEKKVSEFALQLLAGSLDRAGMSSAKDIYNNWLRGYMKKAGIEASEHLLV